MKATFSSTDINYINYSYIHFIYKYPWTVLSYVLVLVVLINALKILDQIWSGSWQDHFWCFRGSTLAPFHVLQPCNCFPRAGVFKILYLKACITFIFVLLLLVNTFKADPTTRERTCCTVQKRNVARELGRRVVVYSSLQVSVASTPYK